MLAFRLRKLTFAKKVASAHRRQRTFFPPSGADRLLQTRTCCLPYLRCAEIATRAPRPSWLVTMHSVVVTLSVLLAGSMSASMPSSAAPPTPLAPPCTEEMLSAIQAGDKNWPIACRNAALAEGKGLDLIEANLSHDDSKDATFVAAEKAKLHGVNPNPKPQAQPSTQV